MVERNYKKEYENYHSKPEQVRNRSTRNKARRIMERKGAVKKGDGKDVDHKRGVSYGNRASNLRVQSASQNRSFPRTKTAGKK